MTCRKLRRTSFTALEEPAAPVNADQPGPSAQGRNGAISAASNGNAKFDSFVANSVQKYGANATNPSRRDQRSHRSRNQPDSGPLHAPKMGSTAAPPGTPSSSRASPGS